jgi:hypothetical protein
MITVSGSRRSDSELVAPQTVIMGALYPAPGQVPQRPDRPDLPLSGATDVMIIVLVDFHSLNEH